MVSKRIQKALEGNSAIRAMFNEGREMAAKYIKNYAEFRKY